MDIIGRKLLPLKSYWQPLIIMSVTPFGFIDAALSQGQEPSRRKDALVKDCLSTSHHATAGIGPEGIAEFDWMVDVPYGQIGPFSDLQGPEGVSETERLSPMARHASQRFFRG